MAAFQVNSWLDALAAFGTDNGWGDFGLVDVGRRSDDETLPAATVILTEVRGLRSANMGLGNDVFAPYANLYVRGAPEDYQGPRDAVWRFMRQLHRIGAATVHGYEFLMTGGDNAPTPSPLGRDEARRFQWTVDVPVWFKAGAEASVTINP